jgi:transposase InsO family protein
MSGSEGGPGKPTSREAGRAPRSDPYTKLKGPKRGEYFDLYVVLDIFSRYVVAWYVSASESGEQAKDLIADAVARHGVPPDQLTIHADRGSSMTSNQVAELLSFLGIKPLTLASARVQ